MRRSNLATTLDDPEALAALGAWLTPEELDQVQRWARAGLVGEPRRPAGESLEDVPRRPPKGVRPQCPVVCPDGHRCRARCWWPKGAQGPEAACSLHLGAQLAADEPPRKLPDKEFQSGDPASGTDPGALLHVIGAGWLTGRRKPIAAPPLRRSVFGGTPPGLPPKAIGEEGQGG